MAPNRYIPNELPLSSRQDSKRRAELFVFDQLREQFDAEVSDWTVAYSVGWLLNRRVDDLPREGEADFVLAHPKLGVLVVEVKGGRIDFKDGQWISRDARGDEHNITPFEQVARNARHLATKFDQLPQWRSAGATRFGRLVIFPDSDAPRNAVYPLDVAAEIVIDRSGMSDLPRRVRLACEFWFRSGWSHPRANRIQETLHTLFGRSLQFSQTLGSEVALESREFNRLTESQFRAVRSVARMRRVAFWGGAGSGKTWLAGKRAAQLADEGFRTLLVCRSVPLAEHLRDRVRSEGDLVIAAYREIGGAVFGLPDSKSRSDADRDYGWSLVEAAERQSDRRFDAILVDEGQDFDSDEWAIFDELLRSREECVFYVFLDDNQQVGSHRTTIPADIVELNLDENVRTTRSIHDRLQQYYLAEPAQRPLGPLGRQVAYVPERDSAADVRETLDRLVEIDRVSPDDVVVLTPLPLQQSRLRNLPLQNGRRLVDDPRPGLDVALRSVADFKGLESAVVVLAEAEGLPTNDAARIRYCYTAFSRARSHLIVLGNWTTEPSRTAES